jgi:hypothetical protein
MFAVTRFRVKDVIQPHILLVLFFSVYNVSVVVKYSTPIHDYLLYRGQSQLCVVIGHQAVGVNSVLLTESQDPKLYRSMCRPSVTRTYLLAEVVY